MPVAKTNKGGITNMDFMNRGNRPVQPNTHPSEHGQLAPNAPSSKVSKLKDKNNVVKYGYVAFVAAITILLVALLLSFAFSKDVSTREFSKVDESKLQAVFLNGGQVYFGDINDLNSNYLSLSNIYYLRVNQQVQPDQQQSSTDPNDISLVKLGCELHGPQDSMVINREQIIFWENLKNDGQVAKAVDEYVKANPDGQKCDQEQTTDTDNNSNTNNSNNGTAPTQNQTNNNGR